MMFAPTIEDIAVDCFTVPTDAPEADGTISWDSTTMVLVRVHSGTVVGTGWTYGPPSCAEVVRHTLSPLIQGQSAFDIPGVRARMDKAVRNSGRRGVVGYAISAVDIALWDLKARLLDLPLHSLLGAVRDEVEIYGSGGFTTYSAQQMSEQLGRWAHEEGIGSVKIKIGQSWGTCVDRDLQRIAEARRIIGDDARLFVDANGAYTAKQAVRVARAAADQGVVWFEEPVSSDNLEGLRAVREAVEADVAAGEYGNVIDDFRLLCTSGAVDVLQIDATRCGGISEWLRAAALAAAFHIEVSAHCAPHLHAAAAAATPNFRHMEWFHDHVRIESMFFDGTLDPAGGSLRLSSRAGHGLTLREDAAADYHLG